MLTGLLVVRTYLSIWLADVNGQVVKAIVNRNFSEFLKRVSTHLNFNVRVLIDLRIDAFRDPVLNGELSDGIL